MAFDASVGYGNNLISLIESLSHVHAQTNQIRLPNEVKTVAVVMEQSRHCGLTGGEKQTLL